MRIDVFLSESGLALSRTEAKGFISEGAVRVNGKVVTKPSFEVSGDEDIELDRSSKKFVSRGGTKLEAALIDFELTVAGKKCLDIGASSGGFTDCLLRYGAEHVIAVDSGYGQMVDSLRCDSRVSVVENFNARYMSRSDLEYTPELVVMDVSFISATYIFPAVRAVIDDGGDFVCLVKPQFEVGKSGLGKGGIVKNDKLRNMAVDNVISSARSYGFELVKIIKSPIVGGDGNTEFLAHFRIGGGNCEKSNNNPQ